MPGNTDDLAGLLLFHDDGCNAVFGKTLGTDGKPCMLLTVRNKNVKPASSIVTLDDDETDRKLLLKVEGKRNKTTGEVTYLFSYKTENGRKWKNVGSPVSADLLSTQTAGGFTGTVAGVYATGRY